MAAAEAARGSIAATIIAMASHRQGLDLGASSPMARWIDVLELGDAPLDYQIPPGAALLRLTPTARGCYANINGPAKRPSGQVLDGSASFPVLIRMLINCPPDRSSISFVAEDAKGSTDPCYLTIEVFG